MSPSGANRKATDIMMLNLLLNALISLVLIVLLGIVKELRAVGSQVLA